MKITEVKREGAQQLVPLYEGQGHRIVDSFLQGIMGRAWAVFEGNGQESKAVSALILAGDFLFWQEISFFRPGGLKKSWQNGWRTVWVRDLRWRYPKGQDGGN